MKKIALVILCALAALPIIGRADQIGITLTLGQLLKADGSTPVPDGALIQLLGDTTSTFGAPTAASFTGNDSNEVVLDSFALNSATIGTTGDMLTNPINLTLQTSPAVPSVGTYLLLRWYPTLTTSSSTPGSGTSYGQFAETTSDQDGSTMYWQIPSAGSQTLSFITTSQGGSNANSAGVANLQVAPEPSTWALLITSMVGGVAFLRRRKA